MQGFKSETSLEMVGSGGYFHTLNKIVAYRHCFLHQRELCFNRETQCFDMLHILYWFCCNVFIPLFSCFVFK